MADHSADKVDSLRKRIKNYEKAVIAFSVVLTAPFSLMVAVQELGKGC